MTENRVHVCAKCGINSANDKEITFHRFPLPGKHGFLKARVWAIYCYPESDWKTEASVKKLYDSHKTICSHHFDDSAYLSSERKKMNKFAIPTEARDIWAQICSENQTQPVSASSSSHSVHKPSPSQATSAEIECHIQIPVHQTPSTSHVTSADIKLHTKKTSKTPILKELGMNKIELTPRKQKLYKRCRRNLSEIVRLRNKISKSKRSKRNILKELNQNEGIHEMFGLNMPSALMLLLQSQLKNVPRKLRGRRWSLDDKVMALSIYKRSSACYRLLKRMFCLPSEATLRSLLNNIPLKCGINQEIFSIIKKITSERDFNENLCILAFDEMSIRKNVSYNIKYDKIDGFQDHSTQGRSNVVATHALTFMAIGIRKKWKQPVAFYFSGDYVTADRLVALIKEVLDACFEAGLHVIGTVCDCDGANIRAMKLLGSTVEKPYFIHKGNEIAAILDPPHLLKCFRNNFLKYNVEYDQDMKIDNAPLKGIAKWSHIQEFHKIDSLNPNFVFAPGLTTRHLQPNGKEKMKVRLAAQVLSHTVAAGMFAKVSQNELPQEALATANLLSKIDKLFDLMNGDSPDLKRGKPHLTNFTMSSPHKEYFKDMKIFFRTMKFIGARSKPPSQEGWIWTMNAIEKIHNILKDSRINSLSTRRLNQDPLENCFGCIRSYCGNNPNPTTVQFIAALKTAMISNLLNVGRNRNCIDDNNDLLTNLKIYLNKPNPGPENATEVSSDFNFPTNTFSVAFSGAEDIIETDQCPAELQACAYVCGFIVKKMKIDCTLCKLIFLIEPDTDLSHLFISYKEYSEIKKSLSYVSNNFCTAVSSAATLINKTIKENVINDNLKILILSKLKEHLDFNWLDGCKDHLNENITKICTITFFIVVKRFCIVKNREFIDEASKKTLKRKINMLKNM